MSTIHFNQTTTLTPDQYIAGLTDFGPGRSKVFSNSADDYLKVHHVGPTEADVTEGSGGVWERLHYDWSNPDRVVLTTTDSNTWGGASGYTYTFRRSPDGATDVNVGHRPTGQDRQGPFPRSRARERRQGRPQEVVRATASRRSRPATTERDARRHSAPVDRRARMRTLEPYPRR